jgi:predicted transcriptional regulator
MNVDMKIYIESVLNCFDAVDEELGISGFDSIRLDFGIDKNIDDNTLKSSLREEIEFFAEYNMIERDSYTLTKSQFESAVVKTATRISIDEMMKQGLIQATLDPEQGENVYSLTEKGRKVGKALDF